MSVETAGGKRNPLEHFSEAPEAAREAALTLAAWRLTSLVAPPLTGPEQAEIAGHIESAIKSKRELARGLTLSTSRRLQEAVPLRIRDEAMLIVRQAEHVVAERFEHAWAANIAPKNTSHDLVEAIAKILDDKHPLDAFRSARVNSVHIQPLSEDAARSIVEGITLFGTLPSGSLTDEDEVTELVEHWSTSSLLNTRTPPDIPGRDTSKDEAYAAQMIRGQEILNEKAAKAPRIKSKDVFNDDELWALAEYYGQVKGAVLKKRAGKRFGKTMPAIHTLVAKVDELVGGRPEGRLMSLLRRRDSARAGTDEAYGRENLNPAALKVLESHWKGADAPKVGIYLRLWAQQLRGGGWAKQTSEESVIYQEGQGVLAEAARRTQEEKRSRPNQDTRPSASLVERIPTPETRALPGPQRGEEGEVDEELAALRRRLGIND